MSASEHARQERADLADTLLVTGPSAPTLCAGWTTQDLAAHLVLREARPDAAVGIVVRPLAGWTDRVMRSLASHPFPELVHRFRVGPPLLSVFALPGMEGATNLVEFVVHHEDVRRAQPAWEARVLPASMADDLWSRLRRITRLTYRSVPVGVTLERTDGSGDSFVARAGADAVTLRGPVTELLLRSYGRRAVLLEVEGAPTVVAAFEASSLSL